MVQSRKQTYVTPMSALLTQLFREWGAANISTRNPTYLQLAVGTGLAKQTLMMLLTGRRVRANRPTLNRLERFIEENLDERYADTLIKRLHKANSHKARQESVESGFFERLLP